MQRIFIGVAVDQRSQRQINDLLKPLTNSNRDIRWVAEQNRHLTLAFLGDQPPAVVDALVCSMDEVYRQVSAFHEVFTGLERFPNSKGKILALVCAANERLVKLFRLTNGLLAQHGLVPEHETFRAHITVGRIARSGLFKTSINQTAKIDLHIDTITLYQSTLTPSGSVYLALKATGLLETNA